MVKRPVGIHASHIKLPEFKSWLCSLFQLYAVAHPGRQPVMARVVWSLSCAWDSQIEFMAPDLALTQPQPFKEKIQR